MIKLRNTYLLMRHEETMANRLGIVSSVVNKFSITLVGRREARRAARLVRLIAPSRIYSSPLRRARETAAIMGAASRVLVRVEPDLREVSFGVCEGKPQTVYEAQFASHFERFTSRRGNGEPLLYVQRRMARAFRRIDRRHDGEIILLVSHGDPLWLLKAWLLGLSPRAATREREVLYLVTGEVQQLFRRGAGLRFRRLYAPPRQFAHGRG